MIDTSLVKGALAAAAALFVVTPALADRADYRQHKQQDRIEQGVKSGRLTPYEAAKLERQQGHIAKIERNFKRDGYLSPSERARLNAEQNRASRNIWAQKHDHEHRGWRNRWGRGWGFGYGRHSYYPYWR
jgi:hypothetical protein